MKAPNKIAVSAEHLWTTDKQLQTRGQLVKAAATEILKQKGQPEYNPYDRTQTPRMTHHGKVYSLYQQGNLLSVDKKIAGELFPVTILKVQDGTIQQNALTKSDTNQFIAAQKVLQKQQNRALHKGPVIG